MGDLLTQIRSTTTTQTCQTKLLLKQPISPKKQIKCDSRKESSPNKKCIEGNSEMLTSSVAKNEVCMGWNLYLITL